MSSRMSSFLKLQGLLLNKRNIQRIEINPDRFRVVITPVTRGWNIFGFGVISTDTQYYDICKEKNPDNYQTISKWMEEH